MFQNGAKPYIQVCYLIIGVGANPHKLFRFMNMASIGNAASSESGTYCSAWGCNGRFSKQVTFHSFPLNDKERLKK